MLFAYDHSTVHLAGHLNNLCSDEFMLSMRVSSFCSVARNFQAKQLISNSSDRYMPENLWVFSTRNSCAHVLSCRLHMCCGRTSAPVTTLKMLAVQVGVADANTGEHTCMHVLMRGSPAHCRSNHFAPYTAGTCHVWIPGDDAEMIRDGQIHNG